MIHVKVWQTSSRITSNCIFLRDEMNDKDSYDVRCHSVSTLDVTVDNVVQVLLNHEEEVEKLKQKKEVVDVEVENLKKCLQQLELEKSEIDAQITTLKLRNAAYQKEHTNFRNAITIVKFQIEKVKECIEKAKERELKDLEDFEKSVDEITQNFRSGQDHYDRRRILEKITEEKERNNRLVQKGKELANTFAEFLSERGLRPRKNEKEELIDCILPGSKLFDLMEMTKNLEEVIFDIRKLISNKKATGDNLAESKKSKSALN